MIGEIAGRSNIETMTIPSEWYDACLENGRQTWALNGVIRKDGKTLVKTRDSSKKCFLLPRCYPEAISDF